jgi:Holliday junction resolvase RusA-like endonuclease
LIKGLICQECGITTPRRAAVQKFCPPCSSAKDLARKSAWARKNPQPSDPAKQIRRKSKQVEAGKEASLSNRFAFSGPRKIDTDGHREVCLAVPFTWSASKNAIWRTGAGGHVYARQESKTIRQSIAAQIAAMGVGWLIGRTCVEIQVEKPNHRGDASNMVDLVCDAVKDGIGVDDRWFSIGRVDWSIVKIDPRIIITVSQNFVGEHRACSHCGWIFPLSIFPIHKSGPGGKGRVCKSCKAPVRGPRACPT